MKNKKTLRELIELARKEDESNVKTNNNHIKETNEIKQKGFHSIEIDNDNGICMYDYLYNDM